MPTSNIFKIMKFWTGFSPGCRREHAPIKVLRLTPSALCARRKNMPVKMNCIFSEKEPENYGFKI